MRRLILICLLTGAVSAMFIGCLSSILLNNPIIMNKPFCTTAAECDSVDSVYARQK